MIVREVAAATALSVATVSRALRDDPKVSAATRERVRAAAKKLGYSHNPYHGQMMSPLRRRDGGTFRGNMALVWKNVSPGLTLDIRRQQVLDGIRERAPAADGRPLRLQHGRVRPLGHRRHRAQQGSRHSRADGESAHRRRLKPCGNPCHDAETLPGRKSVPARLQMIPVPHITVGFPGGASDGDYCPRADWSGNSA